MIEEKSSQHGVDTGIAHASAFFVTLCPAPDIAGMPVDPMRWLWLLDFLAGHLAVVVERNPSDPDLQFAVNVLASLNQYAPKIWTDYQPFLVVAAAQPIVYRFRIAMWKHGRLSPIAQAIHNRYAHATRSGPTGSPEELFDWLVLGGIKDAGY